MVRMFQETIDVNRICTMSNDTLLPRYLLSNGMKPCGRKYTRWCVHNVYRATTPVGSISKWRERFGKSNIVERNRITKAEMGMIGQVI